MADNISSRTALSAAPVQASVNPTGYTRETSEPIPFGAAAGTNWWSYTPASSITVTFTTEGSDGDTTLGIYRLTDTLQPVAVTNLTFVASAHGNAPDGQSKVTVALTAGIEYFIQVGSFTTTLSSLYVISASLTDTGTVRVAHDFAAAIVDTDAPVRVAHDFAAAIVDRDAPVRVAHDFAAAIVDRDAPIRVAHAFVAVLIKGPTVKPWTAGWIRD